MRNSSFSVVLLCVFSVSLSAKEGMWIPYLLGQLNADEMTAMGLEISAEDIYSVNQSSLKDAIVHFDGGCTAELISSKGLLLTNHHCGYSEIQSHSSVEHNYLKDGFWAMSLEEELKNPGVTASIVKYMEDVTNALLEGTNDQMETSAREAKIKENIKALLEKKKADSEYDLQVKAFFYGNQYILIAKETFRDVRLVGAPPSSIGKFGADTDNWVWPRHTGDFSMFRIYSGQDNKPADISNDNRPYTPKQHLKVNIGGIKENDFTMIYGFPGRTMEYLPSNEVRNIMEVYDPMRIGVRDQLLAILDKKMRKDEATRIKYASKYAGISNSWKKWIGEIKGLEETGAIAKKERFEAQLADAINKKLELRNQYGNVLEELKKLYEERKPLNLERYYYIEIGYYGMELMRHLLSYKSLVDARENDEDEKMEKIGKRLAERVSGFYKDYDEELDREAMFTLFDTYVDQVKTEPIPKVIKKVQKMDAEEREEYLNLIMDECIVLLERNEWKEMLEEKPKKAAKKIAKSEAYELSQAMWDHFSSTLNDRVSDYNSKIEIYQGKYLKAIQEVFPLRRMYPDANSTLRVAYGKVSGYEPKDAVRYGSQTYLKGVIAKYVPGDYEFDLPAKLIDLYESKDYGKYADGDKMPVCFIASNHTTGGNSGSPALNGRGQLIGLNFDRTWEGTMSDINYDISRCRNIMVDIRYVLFIVDKFAGAGYLVDEMDLVDSKVDDTAIFLPTGS